MSDKTPPTAEQHAQDAATPAWQFAGLKARMGWATGQTMNRAAYDQALKTWLNGPTVAPTPAEPEPEATKPEEAKK